MSVIINELEVTTQPPEPSAPPAAPARPATAGPTPNELRHTIRHLTARLARVEAD